MADNEIRDGRTLVDAADVVGTVWVDISGSAAVLDTEIKVQGAGSMGEFCTTTRAGTFYRYAADQDLSNTHVYAWFNCGIVGLLDIKANQGLTFRARGPTISNYLEWDLAGSDIYPVAVKGGWVMFVIDLEAPTSRTGGTPPATSAIREIGFTFITASVMPRMADNTWVDAMWTLPDGSPGIEVDGRDQTVSAHDWIWQDIIDAADAGAWGTARSGAADEVILNTPIHFGVTTGTHDQGFTDKNRTIIWDNQEFVASDLYGMTVQGNATGAQNFTLGVKTGTGDDATGAQGGKIEAALAGVRWFFDADDANVDACNLYGVQFIHGSDFQLDDAQISVISCLFLDCTSAVVSNAGDFLRCSVVDANTADGVAFVTTDDLTDIIFCSFEFSDGHAIELTTPNTSTQASKGNSFTGYGADASNDAAIYNNSGAGLVTISVTDGGATGEHTVRNGTSASTSVLGAVTVTMEALDELAAGILNVQCSLFLQSDDSEVINADSNASGIASTTFTGSTPAAIRWRMRKASGAGAGGNFKKASGIGTITAANGFSVTQVLVPNPINST